MVLDEFRRVTKPSGSMLLVTALGATTLHEPVAYADEESRWFVYRDRTALREQVRHAGFRIVTEESMVGVGTGGRSWPDRPEAPQVLLRPFRLLRPVDPPVQGPKLIGTLTDAVGAVELASLTTMRQPGGPSRRRPTRPSR